MARTGYLEQRDRIAGYFDGTAAERWAQLTSEAPVGRIRATVRAGRDRMRSTLLSWLPDDLNGRRLLDAGCGTGALAIEAARRGARVVAIDLSPTLVTLARERLPADLRAGSIELIAGDMLDATLGEFDHVVCMDSLIHYRGPDAVRALAVLAARARRSVAFTFAPRTVPLAMMHAVGRLFPSDHRAPSIEPMAEPRLRERLAAEPALREWRAARTQRIASGFYTSQALELVRADEPADRS